MKTLIHNHLQGQKVLLFFILANIIYVLMLTVTIPHLVDLSGGLKILDMMPTGYDLDYVQSLFTALGEEGRTYYLFRQIPLDLVYPFLYGISFCLLLAFLLNKLGKFDSTLFYFCLLPLAAGVFDYCENIGSMILLNQYPDISGIWVRITNVFTLLKIGFTTVYFIVLIVTLIAFGIRIITKKKSNLI